MTQTEALKLALEALENIVYWYQVRDKNENPLPVHNQNPEIKQSIETITAIKEALAQPEQEPVATVTSETGNPDIVMSWWHEPALPVGTPLYTTPPQRTWVGLTEQEANQLWESTDSDWELMKRTEAKLKEKNT